MFEVIRFGEEQCKDKFGSLCEGMRQFTTGIRVLLQDMSLNYV